jgi:hypothetical protein
MSSGARAIRFAIASRIGDRALTRAKAFARSS